MPPCFSVTEQWQTATKRMVLCCGCVGLSFLAIVGFGLVPRTQASENILPNHQVSATPTKIQPKLVASYGKLPLSFEANQGQTDARVRFLARGGGYTIFLTDEEAVLTLRKSSPGMNRLGKVGLPGRLHPFGPVDPRAGRWPGLGDDLESLWRSLIPDLGQMVPDPSAGKGAAAGPESQPPQVIRMRLLGGNAKGRVVGLDELPGKSNYFIGNDPRKWRTNVPSYAQVKYEGVYPGVDLVYYGNQRQLEYDFVVEPGADPNQIKLSFAGADGMRVDAASGDLVLKLGIDEVRFRKPAAYQPAVAAVSSPASPFVASAYGLDARHSSLVTRHSSFVLASNNQVAFRVAGYDPQRALVIDPVLSYSTYLGGSDNDWGNAIAVDSSGNAYVTGYTRSTDFPTANPLQSSNHGKYDAFVAKLNSAGSALVYSTYLGGSKTDGGTGIAVDSSGNAYVTGQTYSTDFPIANPIQASNNASNGTAFVAELNAADSALVYSTYLGGSSADAADGIALDSAGNAYVTGYTQLTDFPTRYPLQPTNKAAAANPGDSTAFVAKLNFTASATPPLTLAYSTYLGGSNFDEANGIAVDSSGNAYVTGYTFSTDFPTMNPYQATLKGDVTVFVTQFNAAGSALLYSTYLGGSYADWGYGIAVDAAGNAYVTGLTGSTDFPIQNPFQATCGGCSSGNYTAFVAKLNPAASATPPLTLVYSTYLGGSTFDLGFGIGVDSAGNAYVTGYTYSTDFPTKQQLQPNCDGCSNGDAFVSALKPAGNALVYSNYLGGSNGTYAYGITVDSAGDAYVTGETDSTDFPTMNPLQASYGGGGADAFVTEIWPAMVDLSPTSLTFGPQNVGTTSAPQTMTLTITGEGTLLILNTTVSGDFAQTNNCGSSLANSSCTISVTFTPTTAGGRSGSITFTSNATVVPYSVSLTGTGTAPVAGVSTTTLTFSNQGVGTTSASQPVTLSNTGTAALTIASIATSAKFGQTNNCGGSVAASGSCTINVTFSPTAAGRITGTLTITDNNNEVTGSTQTVALSGTGVELFVHWPGPIVLPPRPPSHPVPLQPIRGLPPTPPVTEPISVPAPMPAPATGLAPSSLTFSAQIVGTRSSAQTVTLANTGNSTLTLTGIATSANFGQTNNCGGSVAARGSCTINVTFSPTATGSLAGTLTITDNSKGVAGSKRTVTLSGTGTNSFVR